MTSHEDDPDDHHISIDDPDEPARSPQNENDVDITSLPSRSTPLSSASSWYMSWYSTLISACSTCLRHSRFPLLQQSMVSRYRILGTQHQPDTVDAVEMIRQDEDEQKPVRKNSNTIHFTSLAILPHISSQHMHKLAPPQLTSLDDDLLMDDAEARRIDDFYADVEDIDADRDRESGSPDEESPQHRHQTQKQKQIPQIMTPTTTSPSHSSPASPSKQLQEISLEPSHTPSQSHSISQIPSTSSPRTHSHTNGVKPVTPVSTSTSTSTVTPSKQASSSIPPSAPVTAPTLAPSASDDGLDDLEAELAALAADDDEPIITTSTITATDTIDLDEEI